MLKRETRYPHRMMLSLSDSQKAALTALSERTQTAPAVLARWAVEAGLPIVRDRERKRARKTGRNEGGEK